MSRVVCKVCCLPFSSCRPILSLAQVDLQNFSLHVSRLSSTGQFAPPQDHEHTTHVKVSRNEAFPTQLWNFAQEQSRRIISRHFRGQTEIIIMGQPSPRRLYWSSIRCFVGAPRILPCAALDGPTFRVRLGQRRCICSSQHHKVHNTRLLHTEAGMIPAFHACKMRIFRGRNKNRPRLLIRSNFPRVLVGFVFLISTSSLCRQKPCGHT